MRLRAIAFGVAMLLVAPSMHSQAVNTLTTRERAAGWTLLFDGKSTSAWRSVRSDQFPRDGWEVKDGLLSVTEHGGEEGGNAGDIISRRTYTNFEFSVDFRVTPGANSGFLYFVDPSLTPGHEGRGTLPGFEYQILDDALHPDAKKGRNGDRRVASLYDLIPAAADKPIRPAGEWNTARVVVRGAHGEHWLNGVKVLEYDRNSAAFRQAVVESKFHVFPGFGQANGGYLVLQDHGFPVSFRSIKIRELRPSPK